MVTEEFSFPTIYNNNVTHFTVTSSLWRISSLEVYSDFDQFEITGEKGIFRGSFPRDIGETEGEFHRGLTEMEVENKMDLLWEDFNNEDHDEDDGDDDEDFDQGQSSLGISGLEDHESYEKNGLEDAAELCCVQTLKMSKTGPTSLVLSQKKHKMVLVLKFLMKKLLLLQKMARMKRRGS